MEARTDCVAANSGWRVLLVLTALCAMPFASGAWLYASGWRPASNSAHGELVQPPQSVGAVELGEDGNGRVSLGKLAGRWTLVYFGAAECSLDCMRSLYVMRQVQVAQGSEQERVQRIFVASGENSLAGAAALVRVFPGLRVVAAREGAASRWPDSGGGQGRIYLVDPMGNLVMRYTGNADPGGMRKDLSRLLAYSWVG